MTLSDLDVRIWGEGHPERVVLLHGGNVPALHPVNAIWCCSQH
jgi:hypothetical protein